MAAGCRGRKGKAGKQASGGKQAQASRLGIRASTRYYANGTASARLGLARAPALARLCPAVSPSVGFSMPLRRPRRSSVTRLSFCFCPTRTTRHATPHRAAPCRAARHATPHRTAPRRSSRCSLPQARAVVSLFPRSIRLALPFEPRRCYILLPFSPSLLFLAPASSLPPFRPFSQDVCFIPSEILSFLAVFVVRSSSSPSSFQVAHVSVRSTSLFKARLHRDGNIP